MPDRTANSWQVTLDDKGHVQWVSGEDPVAPVRDEAQRAEEFPRLASSTKGQS